MNDNPIEERNELFDSAVREQLTGYEPTVPHALWNRISAELDKGEASTEPTHIPHYHAEKTTFGKWRIAIAAAVLLTLTVGTLLYTINPTNETKTTLSPIANTVNTKTEAQPVATAPIQVTVAKMVAQTAPVAKKNTVPAPSVSTTKTEPATIVASSNTNEPASVENAPAKQEQTAQDMQLEFSPVTTQNNPVEVGNIPLASLNFLSTPTSLNDEITVIKSAEPKKKHGRKDESTKIIMIGKKFDSKPDIRYQVPVRF